MKLRGTTSGYKCKKLQSCLPQWVCPKSKLYSLFGVTKIIKITERQKNGIVVSRDRGKGVFEKLVYILGTEFQLRMVQKF